LHRSIFLSLDLAARIAILWFVFICFRGPNDHTGYNFPVLIKSLFKYWTYQVFAPGTVLREKYEAFKSLLENDKRAHELMAELEEIYHNHSRVDFTNIEARFEEFAYCVSQIIENLIKMCPTSYLDLRGYFKKFDSYIRYMLGPSEYDVAPPFTLALNEIPSDGPSLVGGKAFNLSAIGNTLHLPIPEGFAITTNAYHYFIEFNDLRKKINENLSELDIECTECLDAVSHQLMEMIVNAQVPPEIEEKILAAYRKLMETAGPDVKVAMRSSAMGEDTESSFAGQYLTVLNVSENAVLDAYKDIIASKYSSGALYYRINYGLPDIETPMAVLVLEMIDAQTSGIIYTKDIDNPEAEQLKIHCSWGLGELLVSGKISADIFTVSKETKPKIVEKHIADKLTQLVNLPDGLTAAVPLDNEKQHALSLADEPALDLSGWGIKLESYFQEPQDIEWCMDRNGHIFLLQSRPLRAGAENPTQNLECNFDQFLNDRIISGGESASAGIGAGVVFKIDHENSLDDLQQGAVLVARNASPQYVKIMSRLNAVVTDTGSTASHFSSVAREFGVPALVNTGNATARLAQGREVTVHADDKAVYDGILQPMLESPCARKDLISDSPFMRRMKSIMSFISLLELVDPAADNFTAEGCRSLHDIIRFCHEKAVQEMFHIGDRRIRKIGGTKKLASEIPMLFYVLDVGGGLKENARDQKNVTLDEICNVPLRALMKGLRHPEIHWGEFTHFDWAEYDKIVMSGGIISPEAAMFASHAVLSSDYMNLNLRFGYHFVILDTLCSDQAEDNYILFRFSGGGADFDKRMLRADFLSRVLYRIGLEVNRKSDLVDARIKGEDRRAMENKLDLVGRLLGATRLMDMYLKDESMVEGFVEDFMKGRYHFATVDD
jgi:pyruvate,water dikinase